MTLSKKFEKYLYDCLNDKIPASKSYKLAIERFLNDLFRKDLIYKEKEVEKVINYAERLCFHWKGRLAGQPLKLANWQKFYFANIYGLYFTNGTRKYRRSYLQIARKNGKTTTLAIQGLYHISKEVPEGGQCYVIATKEDQARICTTDAGNITRNSRWLYDKFKLHEHKEYINIIRYGTSFIKPLGSDSRRQDGLHASMLIGDESHEWSFGKNDKLYKVVEDSGQGRDNFLSCVISTAGFNKDDYGYKIYLDNKNILEGITENDRQFALIFELDEGDDWKDKTKWAKASPGIEEGILDIENDLIPAFTDAKNNKGFDEVNFKTKYLNSWVDAPDVWLSDEEIQACNNYQVQLDSFKNRKVYAGIDLAKTQDLNALALVSKNEKSGKLDVLLYYWMPEAKLNARDRVDYRSWVDKKLIKTTDGNVIDHDTITNDIIHLMGTINIQALYYDKFLFESNISINKLYNSGLHNLHPISQGTTTLDEPMKELERMVTARLINFNNDVLRWNFRNLRVKMDGNGYIAPDRKDDNRANKIDGVSALVNAIKAYLDDQNQSQFFIV